MRVVAYPRVSIIILNWNGREDTIECLESLYRINYPNYDVIIVDNGSRDDSAQKIKEYAEGNIEINSKFFRYNPHNKPIKVFEITEDEAKQGEFNRPAYEKFDPDRRMILIKNKDNYGFAGGNNIGIKFALSVLNPDYVLLLNNDTVVDPNFLTELVKVAESDEKIGIVGPKIYYYDYKGRSDVIVFTGAKLTLWNGKEYRYGFQEVDNNQWDKLISVGKIEGSCMLIKTEVIKNIGFLKHSFFAYWEETDFCFRAREHKYDLIYVPTGKIWHKVEARPKSSSWFRIYLMNRNKWIFIRENLKTRYLVLNLAYFLFVDFWINSVRYFLLLREAFLIKWYLLGNFDGLISGINRIKGRITSD